MKALIIEDETVAAQSLQALIREIDAEIEIAAVLQTIDETVEWFETSPAPDLVFMDIHLADGSAFTIFEHIEIPCPVIFTTAYDEYALRAFEVNSIDYILKPVDRRDLERAIRKYRNFNFQTTDNSELINKLLTNIKSTAHAFRSNFLFAVGDKLVPVAANDIAAIYIDGSNLKAATLSGQTFYLDKNLEEWQQSLDPQQFFRANRQYIISRRAVKDVSIWFAGKLSVNLSVAIPERIIVSKARTGEFKKWLAE
jgi:two-component system LytT family response regulator